MCVGVVVAVAWLHGGGMNDRIVMGAYCVVSGVVTVVGRYELFCLMASG